MAPYKDKSDKGTAGLIFRERLEYGVGHHTLAHKWDLLWSMHSHQVSVNPEDEGGSKPSNCKYSLNELIRQNDAELLKYIEISLINENSLIDDKERKMYAGVLAQCLKRIDEVNKRGNLVENVRATEGTLLP